MNERRFKWKVTKPGDTARLYAAIKGNKYVDDNSDPSWYASVWTQGGKFHVHYWELATPLDEGLYMEGDWVDLCACDTFEDAMTAAENALRLNLGGWP